MMIAVVFAFLLLMGCAQKQTVQVDWNKIVEVRLKKEVAGEGEIDMRWISLPSSEEKEEKKSATEEEIME